MSLVIPRQNLDCTYDIEGSSSLALLYSTANGDIIIEQADNCLHIEEIKFSSAPYVIIKKYAAELRLKETVFSNNTGYKHQIFYTMITSQGLIENKYSREVINQAITVEQLM